MEKRKLEGSGGGGRREAEHILFKINGEVGIYYQGAQEQRGFYQDRIQPRATRILFKNLKKTGASVSWGGVRKRSYAFIEEVKISEPACRPFR